jgi:hypothetical protein
MSSRPDVCPILNFDGDACGSPRNAIAAVSVGVLPASGAPAAPRCPVPPRRFRRPESTPRCSDGSRPKGQPQPDRAAPGRPGPRHRHRDGLRIFRLGNRSRTRALTAGDQSRAFARPLQTHTVELRNRTHTYSAGAFVSPDFLDRMSKREASAVDHSSALSPDRPAWPVTAVSAATGGGALWLAIAAVMATQPGPLRLAAREGALAVIAASATSHAVAVLVRRARPPAANLPAFQALLHHPTSPSFPSTHTAMAAAFTTAVMARHRGLGLALMPVAAFVAYSRVRTRAHWPTDVAAGGLCGALIGAAVHAACVLDVA